MIIVRTPLRLSLLGGGSDYPEHYTKQGGAVLVSSIDAASYVTLRRLPPYFEHKTRITWTKVELVGNNLEIEHPGIRAVFKYLNDGDTGLEIHYDSDIPARSGVGSSSAFVIGLLNAYWHLTNEGPMRPSTLARTAIDIERNIIGDTIGVQDQISAAYGGVNLVIISKSGEFTVRRISLSRLTELEQRLFMVFTGFSRHSSDVAATQNFDANIESLNQLAAMAIKGAGLLQDNKSDLNELFQLVAKSWEIKKKLSSAILTDGVKVLESQLLNTQGVVAIRLMGAGGGGFFLVCCEQDSREKIMQSLTDRVILPVRFSHAGSRMIFKSQH